MRITTRDTLPGPCLILAVYLEYYLNKYPIWQLAWCFPTEKALPPRCCIVLQLTRFIHKIHVERRLRLQYARCSLDLSITFLKKISTLAVMELLTKDNSRR